MTGYQLSSRGELLRVDLPSGDVVEYAHDPLGRRIAKKRNGTAVEHSPRQGRTNTAGRPRHPPKKADAGLFSPTSARPMAASP
jgi:YD repeat-containing protein